MTLQASMPSIHQLRAAYKDGSLDPRQFILSLREKILSDTRNAWITVLTEAELTNYLDILESKNASELALYGIPFAIKDNIDLAGVPTTAACKEFTYLPKQSATIVNLLMNAGAIPLGKTNMDQFATGLVGTRSPFGAVKNVFDDEYISGGSSSGSAVAVASGQVCFSLGTDTAGSGRVPAMLNNLYGLKPSRGLLSMQGVLPACRSLDCPSIFALSATDAAVVFDVASGFDPDDSYSRKNPVTNSHRFSGVPESSPVIGIPLNGELEFFGDEDARKQFETAIEYWRRSGAEIVEVSIAPLLQAAKLLYEGPWVAERLAILQSFIEEKPDAMHAVVKQIVSQGEQATAVDAFTAEYQMQAYRQTVAKIFHECTCLMLPTAPTTYKIEQLLADPVSLNSRMGYYTNFMNLLDLCGIAIPAGAKPDGQHAGVTLTAPAFRDQYLLGLAHQWQSSVAHGTRVGALPDAIELQTAVSVKDQSYVDVAVCGAHLTGMPLNWQLLERGASLLATTRTSEKYKMYALAGGPPFRPGLVKEKTGASIFVEVWRLPSSEFGSFVANIPAPLGIGQLELIDGSHVSGFICEPYAIADAKDITAIGDWREFIKRQSD